MSTSKKSLKITQLELPEIDWAALDQKPVKINEDGATAVKEADGTVTIKSARLKPKKTV